MAYSADSHVKRGISWRHREIMDLLHFWGEEKIQEALRNTHRNLDYYERISEQMATRGHRRTAIECRSKAKTMRLDYKRVVAHNSRSGNAPVTCPYYKELESILRGDASVNPKRVARSMVLQVRGQLPMEPLELQEGSEELFSGELVTINTDDIDLSTTACVAGEEDNGESVEPVGTDSDLDATPDFLMHPDDADPGNQNQELTVADENNPPCTPVNRYSLDSRAVEVGDATLSPGTRIAGIRSRRRVGQARKDTAEKLLEQSAKEHAEEMEQRKREQEATLRWRETENRRQVEFLEENRVERSLFMDAWRENIEVMRSAVLAMKAVGESMQNQQPCLNQDIGAVPVVGKRGEGGRVGAPKRSCVGKTRERLTL